MTETICFYAPPFSGIKSYRDMIDVTAEYHLTALEGFSMFEFDKPDVKEALRIKKYADERNVKFPCFSVYINLTGDDSEQAINKLKGYADVAAALGAPYLHHTIVANCTEPDKIIPFREELYTCGIACVRKIYDYAKTVGVKTIYEDQGYVFNGVKWFGRFLDEVERDVGVVADFGNIYQSENTIEEFIKAFPDKIVHVHIKDVLLTKEPYDNSLKTLTDYYFNEVRIGDGIVDFKKSIDLLKGAGYKGFYGIEYGTRREKSPEITHLLNLIDSWIS